MIATADEVRATQEGAIVATALDYFEGWFDGDVRRVERAMHPALAKRSLKEDRRTLEETPGALMVHATARRVGKSRDVLDRIEVDVVSVHGHIASAVVRSSVYRKYLHLVRTRDGWRIVNVMWAWT